jgi:hypothetical protein
MAKRQYTCINLDGSTDRALREVAFSLPEGVPRVHFAQRRYASMLILARKNRLQGNIETALGYERQAQEHYETLPKYLRW